MASGEQVYLVQEVVQEGPSVRSYRFDLGLSGLSFTPGQFSVVRHPRRPLRASLTYSSSAYHPRGFELTVKRCGDFGTAFYDEVRPGDALSLTRAAGPNTLDPDAREPLCFIARDYCVPALRSFVRTLREQGREAPLLAIHELSSPAEALFHQELRASRWEAFRLVYLLDAEPSPAWQGLTGRVTSELLLQRLEKPAEARYFLTGEGADVRYYRQQVEALGVPREKIVVERWS